MDPGRARTPRVLAVLLLLALSGCTAFPWTQPDALRARPADPRAEEKVPHNSRKPPALGATELDPIVSVMHSVNDNVHTQFAVLSQQLAAAGDDNKVYAGRLQYLEEELRARDESLAQASTEIQAATDELLRTRTEIQRWKKEFEGLRGRLGNMEKENAEVLDSIIRALEKSINQQRPLGKSPEPEQLDFPRSP